MFYLLKSTVNREEVGDVLLDLERVESMIIGKKSVKDRVDRIYVLKVTMQSNDDWQAMFQTQEELKKVIKEILGDKIEDQALNDFIPQFIQFCI